MVTDLKLNDALIKFTMEDPSSSLSFCFYVFFVAYLCIVSMNLIAQPHLHLCMLCMLLLWIRSYSNDGNTGDFVGSISIEIPAGTSGSPYYQIVSPSLKGQPVFRGLVDSVVDNNISFSRVPDLLDPTTLSNPFKPGMLVCKQARANSVIDANGTVASLTLTYPGLGYQVTPEVVIDLPTEGNQTEINYDVAQVEAKLDGSGQISSFDVLNGGRGYSFPPKVTIEGGPHYLRVADLDSNHRGKFFRITSNSEANVIVDNNLSESIVSIFTSNSPVEIFKAWTLGSLFGYDSTSFNEGDDSVADYVYILKSSGQDGTPNDFVPYFHDGTAWRAVSDTATDYGDVIIPPDEAMIIARRSTLPLDLVLSGTVRTQSTFIELPKANQRALINNPFGLDIMLSDLIPPSSLTQSDANLSGWLANESQELADNVMVLNNGVWETFWHDGTNMGITEKAYATARAGSGTGGSLMQQDISLASGLISNLTNPSLGTNITVTSVDHGLRNGFMVKIEGARGYKTDDDKSQDDNKSQVDENGTIVADGYGLLIESAANGSFLATNCTTDTFELDGKSGNCDFYDDGNAFWSTGSRGAGYSSDTMVSFVGGGGSGGKGIAKVNAGTITSISITDPGAGYVEAPNLLIHSGGWNRMGAGRSPSNDLTVPAGSGILLLRNHPGGIAARVSIGNPLE